MSGINERNGVVADIKPGNALQMARIPVGTVVHNIELYPGKGGQMCRAAGTYAQLVAKEGNYALLRLPSGEVRKVLATCVATVGQVGNVHHETISLGKAGRNRWLGRRPKVRGVAMGVVYEGFVGDAARTFPVGKVSDEARKLMATLESVRGILPSAIRKKFLGCKESCSC